MAKREVIIHETRRCSDEYGVTTIETKGDDRARHRRTPCPQCPWRMDVATGVFPPDAFRESANTAYDGAIKTFGCHMSSPQAPRTCAGFLLRHAENNIGVRLALNKERIDLEEVSDGGVPVYPSYREMAIANGVPADDPSLEQIRAQGDEWDRFKGRWVKPENKGE
jgi:hypothetical protein|nr:DUF6283 family protein [Neorhizobium tomejilense]